MKKSLFLFALLAFTRIFAQSGASCTDAKIFESTNSCLNNVQNNDYLWFKFTANAENEIIELRNLTSSIGHIHSIGLLSGNCNSFTILDSTSVTNGNDSLLILTANGLTIGGEYYIVTKKDNNTCLKCTAGNAEFNICIREVQAAMDACITNVNTNTTVCCYHLEPVTSCVINACVGDLLQLYLNPNTIDVIDNTGIYPNSCVNWIGASTTGVPMNCLPSGCFPYNSTINCNGLLPGTYNVSATLQNTGVYTGQTVHFIINVFPVPTAQIISINPSPACVEESVCVNTTASGSTITIDFGDSYNMVYSGVNLGAYTGTDCHIYNFPGTYTVTITSETGCGTVTQTQIIKINNLEPEFSSAKKCVGVGTVFTDLTTCADPSTTWFWDFGDGNTSNQQNPVHIYNNPGTYTVTLTVTNTNISNTISHTITIQPAPATPTLNNLADFSTCKLGIPIQYNISNYNPNNNYSVSVFPFSIPPNPAIGTASSVDASGNFNVIWNVNTTCQLVITTTTSEGCEASAIVDILPCCSWNDPSKPSFINGDNTTTMQNIPGFATITGNNTIVTNKDFSINGTFTVNKDLIIRGCNVMFGNDAKIVITPGAKLSIQNLGNDVSHLFACDKMWDGIYVDGFVSSSLLAIINGTTVEDAKNAVVSNNGGKFVIQGNPSQGNVIFNKNYRGVVVNSYNGALHPGTIRATTFECYDAVTQFTYSNSNRLRLPYATVRSSLGIQVNNVKNINIGVNALPSKNTFDNMDYGIVTDNSSATIYNNFFVNITQIGLINPKEFCPKGTAVCARGNSNIFINSKVVVGNDAANSITFKPNTFTNCHNGIVAYRNVSLDASKNVFTNVNQGIGLFQNYLKTERVYYNTMNAVRTGVNVYDNNTSGIYIWQNTINTNNQGNGVTANEIIGNSNAFYRISRNTISNVRNGIYVVGVKNAAVDSNVVNIDHSATSNQACNGIYMANSSFSKIRRNSIYGENRQDWWVNGIRVFYSVTDTVTCNLTSNLGSGLLFDGTQTPGTLVARNRMSDNFRGLTLAYSIIGPQYIQNGANQDA
ncbi:MAG: PKD domain-containing protein, partial [Bacteroidia bacterium]|nr:PKD domain-containing protein [Bacteroidia bacterium]